ncbi:unnamed protein product [Sphenostylis stenocarpa]|uniref:Casein kinase II subunit beta n=1 Tax=Sphenostylis stenocarpa TaxID=92480 RepID=A0AA86SD69_9FABA|nr:unnamed protein product [Sphenostylis stenocarpa]
MYKERGGVSVTVSASASKSEDRKRINDVLDKHLERSSPSTSRPVNATSKNSTLQAEESETESEESDVSGSDGDDTSWISWFCNLRGNEFFCEVDDDYIQDDFNLCGLSSQVPYYDYALDLILDVESSHGDMFTEEQNELIESAAEMLYGLIHARYVLTSKGMAAMLDKYKNYDFGRCPRVYCSGQPCLPVGQSDIPRASTVKIYCPRCEDLYYPRSKYQGNIDGAYFGTTFPHLFLMTYGQLKPQKPSQGYVPRVFGFKLPYFYLVYSICTIYVVFEFVDMIPKDSYILLVLKLACLDVKLTYNINIDYMENMNMYNMTDFKSVCCVLNIWLLTSVTCETSPYAFAPVSIHKYFLDGEFQLLKNVSYYLFTGVYSFFYNFHFVQSLGSVLQLATLQTDVVPA